MLEDGIHPNLKLLSESSQRLLHTCPRRYQLYKLFQGVKQQEEGDEHLNFGSAVGAGSQALLIDSEDMDAALFAAFLAFDGDIDDEYGARSKKTFWHALIGVQKFYEFRHSALHDWDIAILDGKPAIELGYVIDCGDGFYHRGFLDALLINRRSQHLMVYEGKTTTYNKIHEAAYINSGQALGYSIIVDAVAKRLGQKLDTENYDVFYAVYKSSGQEWQDFKFPKNNTMRAMWIKQLFRDMQHVAEYAQDNYFPRHGESCYSFFRPCPYLDICGMRDENILGPLHKIEVQKESEDKYQFKFTLDELITAQLEKHS